MQRVSGDCAEWLQSRRSWTTYIGRVQMIEDLTIRQISDPKSLPGLRTVWDTLSEKVVCRPFLSFGWFETWLRYFLGENELLILLLYGEERVVGIAPFLIQEYRTKGITVRQVELIGNIYSPVRDLLLENMDSTRKMRVAEAVLRFFTETRKDWDILAFDCLPEESNTLSLLRGILKKRKARSREYECFGNWFSEGIECPSEAYFRNRSANLRASVKLNYKRARELGRLEFRIMDAKGMANGIVDFTNLYFGVYEKSWKKRERIGKEFLIDWMKEAYARGWLRFGVVYLNDLPMSIGFAIVCDGVAYFEKSAFDERYGRLGPGSIWLYEMMKHVIDVDAVRVVDLLRGDEEYKKRWVEKRRRRLGVHVYNGNAKGMLMYLMMRHISPWVNSNRYSKGLKAFFNNMISRHKTES